MKVVLDANRLFSALLRDGATRKAIFEAKATLYAPKYLKAELARHRGELLRRSKMDAEGFSQLVVELERQVVWVQDSAIQAHLAEANIAMGTADMNDVPYLACALAVKAHAIWSHDLDFDKQSLVPRIPHSDAALP